ncbi:UDP-N-acetyl-D-glucosamine dehydrogenase [Candidatus Nanopelagicus limnes]|uniref:UDP-N-acetyl-D-glucosamine dehydrogenase n=1 Tax=Candidatus Nanopelagicus limnae TaxID=1884634 RepID=A0A249JZ88_9ACTN|nr:nucleotide sugar dehydrogenase [Candidatus Nanopelagicus limnes]ASY09837.1 UDP-N-acetyl-D-glucosamine dehydrogenase [Candidatus Nanopelagicus limnes]
MQITVVGQGYVGLPLAIAAADAGFKVFGLDLNQERITLLSRGISLIEDLNDEAVLRNLKSKNYEPTTNPKTINQSEIVLICVPTPITNDNKPDLEALISATTTVGRNLKAETLVIVESTIEPGTCRNILLPIMLKESGLKLGEFEIAYSPERIDPTNKKWGIRNTPKLVAGLTDNATKRAEEFYEKFIESIIICSSLEIAETAKLLENTFRLVNISFINELAIFCQKMGIDITEVISAAATKPYGFMPFYPGVGVGGHCIPVDPLYLAHAAKSIGAPTRLIDLADQINQEMPGYFVGRAEEKISGLKNKKVLVVGVSYKPNVADVRESPVESLITGLKQKGAQVSWHDDLVKVWNGEESVALSSDFDLAIIATPHDYLDLLKLGNVPILNTRGSI